MSDNTQYVNQSDQMLIGVSMTRDDLISMLFAKGGIGGGRPFGGGGSDLYIPLRTGFTF